jgi:uncharacterized membrane protein YfcA
MNLDFGDFAVICVGLALGGFMKGITGVGLPLVAVPVMAGFLGVERAVIIMVIPSVVLNLAQAWVHRKAFAAVPEIPRVLVGGAIGAAFGGSLLLIASDQSLALGLAAWLVAYVVFRLLHPSFALSELARRRWSPFVGAAAGAMQAATGISAPIVVPYMDALRLRPFEYVFAVCAPFGAFATAHCLLLAGTGSYSGEILLTSVLAVVPAIAVVPVGARCRRYFAPRVFDIVIRMTLLVMAARLVWSALG